ncbi:MAG TPA: GNAT family protein [Paracoccus sp. (in: a-proteobacteria)]|nr:GNAT family protein [Paracoccus sp. (in: a-proteobacteria)]
MSQPLGLEVPGFVPPPAPGPDRIAGRFVTLERLDPARHADALFAANADQDRMWDYMGYGPWRDAADYRGWQAQMAASVDPFLYALRDNATGQPGGIASFLRVDSANGVIEIGHIAISPIMQRTPAASEAIMLMIAWAFDSGYRRVEWKCNDLNAGSMRAAARYGFRYEGTFRNHMVVKGRNRDTAWWAITAEKWPALRAAHDRWLDPRNFGPDGAQVESLTALTAALRPRSDQ